ncbi:MAG TPA: MerP protein [Cytophagales bacterium]|jgi:mercuric ion binding protein|nr:MerP protein [Cytophagales bacterium]
MKKYVLIIVLLALTFGTKAQTKTVEIQTSAVCIMCKNTIERDMAYEKGVKSSDLDLDTKILTVEYNAKKTDPDKIRTRITQIGYHADDKKRDPEAYSKLPECCQDGGHAEEKQ